jgi:uncharacterized protein
VLLERDAAFERTDAIFEEVARLRAIPRGARPDAARELSPAPLEPESMETQALASAQAVLAEKLTAPDAVTSPDVAIQRARSILVRKRADDALPLLPELSPRLATCQALSLGRIREEPRLTQMTAVADAMRIAEAAREVPELSHAAARDWLVLNARFAGGPASPRPRAMPWLGRAGEVWAWKGFGRQAAVRVIERGARR